jgi:hypothetical protein
MVVASRLASARSMVPIIAACERVVWLAIGKLTVSYSSTAARFGYTPLSSSNKSDTNGGILSFPADRNYVYRTQVDGAKNLLPS